MARCGIRAARARCRSRPIVDISSVASGRYYSETSSLPPDDFRILLDEPSRGGKEHSHPFQPRPETKFSTSKYARDDQAKLVKKLAGATITFMVGKGTERIDSVRLTYNLQPMESLIISQLYSKASRSCGCLLIKPSDMAADLAISLTCRPAHSCLQRLCLQLPATRQ